MIMFFFLKIYFGIIQKLCILLGLNPFSTHLSRSIRTSRLEKVKTFKSLSFTGDFTHVSCATGEGVETPKLRKVKTFIP